MTEFAGLVALVTGGAAGIGAATVELLRQRGARVAVLDRDVGGVGVGGVDVGGVGVGGVGAGGVPDGLLPVRCDVTDAGGVDRAVAEVVERFGRLDVVVNNAGIGAVGDVSRNGDEEWAHVLDVNVTGIARVSRAALPHLRRSEHPVIVNTCSAVAFVGVRQRALYGASKGAVLALTLAMAADLVTEGIRVNAVAPGTTDTAWVTRLLDAAEDPAAAAAGLRARQPMGRLVTAGEVAHAIVSLASPAAASTTGAVVRVDGGMTGLRL